MCPIDNKKQEEEEEHENEKSSIIISKDSKPTMSKTEEEEEEEGGVDDVSPSSSSLLLCANKEMCLYCFDVIIDSLESNNNNNNNNNKSKKQYNKKKNNNNNNNNTTMEETEVPEFMKTIPLLSSSTTTTIECPLFVTWEKRRLTKKNNNDKNNNNNSRHIISSTGAEEDKDCNSPSYDYYDLRGCIGTLLPRPLQTALKDYALTSAFRDRRFEPITIYELSRLRVSVSLLVNYEECSNTFDWTVGVHGIIIKFNAESQHYNATFLPEVAHEQGWNQQETITSLIRKSGYHGHINDELLNCIKCTRYQSSKYRLTYEEYMNSIKEKKDDDGSNKNKGGWMRLPWF